MSTARTCLVASLRLLLDIVLGTALCGLASIVHLLVLSLLGTVTRQACHSVANGTANAVRCTGSIVGELTASFLLLALEVLLPTGLLQIL